MKTFFLLSNLISAFMKSHSNLILGIGWLLIGILTLAFNSDLSKLSGKALIVIGLIYLSIHIYKKIIMVQKKKQIDNF